VSHPLAIESIITHYCSVVLKTIFNQLLYDVFVSYFNGKMFSVVTRDCSIKKDAICWVVCGDLIHLLR
jgi:superfamily II RNA helicase